MGAERFHDIMNFVITLPVLEALGAIGVCVTECAIR